MKITVDRIFCSLAILLMVSLVYSKFLLSVSMIGLVVLSIFHSDKGKKVIGNKTFLLLMLLCLMYIPSILNSDDMEGWTHHVRMRLPFLFLPIAFYRFPNITEHRMLWIHKMFFVILFISAIPVSIHYLSDIDGMQKMLAQGQPIPTPVNHIKYSIFIAYAILIVLWICLNRWSSLASLEKKIGVPLIVLMVLFIHLLAVRSGIVVFYGGLIVLGFMEALQKKKYKILIATLVICTVLPFVAFKTLPSLNKRIHYMLWDLDRFREGNGDDYSDSERINSLLIGYEILKENMWVGTGIGDFQSVCAEKYNAVWGPEKKVLYPHNQFLFILGACGILGFLLFIAGMYGPWMTSGSASYTPLIILLIVASLTFMVDNILERSFSAGWLAFFYCLFLNHIRDN